MTESEIDEGLFFERVSLCRAGGGAGRGSAFDRQQRAIACETLEQRLNIEERSHVGGLLLNPDDLGG